MQEISAQIGEDAIKANTHGDSMRILMTLICLAPLAFASADTENIRVNAAAAASAGKTSTAIMLYRQLVAQNPGDGAASYRLGSLLMDNDGNLDEASAAFVQAGAAGFQPVGVAFRLSRVYARQGQVEKSLEQFEKMASAGFSMINLIESESDYDSIRGNARYVTAEKAIRSARFPCHGDPRKREFDFWLGEWQVTQGGQFAGRNNIGAILGGCVLFEQWRSATGVEGRSFNYYDPAYDHWRQIWVDDSGVVIEFTGEARDAGIYYTAETIANEQTTHHKFEFTQNGDGTVRQFWQTSPDRQTWTTIWDGHYAPVAAESD